MQTEKNLIKYVDDEGTVDPAIWETQFHFEECDGLRVGFEKYPGMHLPAELTRPYGPDGPVHLTITLRPRQAMLMNIDIYRATKEQLIEMSQNGLHLEQHDAALISSDLGWPGDRAPTSEPNDNTEGGTEKS